MRTMLEPDERMMRSRVARQFRKIYLVSYQQDHAMRILLVEDEPRVAAFLQQGLAEEGYEVDWVSEGRTAMQRAVQNACDLILLDLRLPDIAGLAVCRHIRQYNASVPILMLTALDAIEDRVTGLRAGADEPSYHTPCT